MGQQTEQMDDLGWLKEIQDLIATGLDPSEQKYLEDVLLSPCLTEEMKDRIAELKKHE